MRDGAARGVQLTVGLALLLGAAAAQGGPVWSTGIANVGVPSAPATDLSYNPTSPSVYVAQNTRLYAFDATSAGAGALRWMKDYSPTVLSNYPSPVPLKGGQNVIFFGGSDGRLYAVNAANGSSFWAAPVDLRRAGCTLEDKIIATPAVQLWSYADSRFRTAINDDLVIVATRYGCSATAENRIYGLRASTGAIAWTFNLDASYALDYASEGCALDYASNRAYCAFNQPAGTTQASLYSIDTTTGARVWSANAGAIRTRPVTRGSNVYVATYDGFLKSRALSNGAAVWSTRVTSTFNIARNPWAETRWAYGNWILIVDSGGNLYAYNDTATTPLQWVLANYGATSVLVSRPFENRVYVGKGDGTVHELRYSTGAELSSYRVGSSTGAIYDSIVANEVGTAKDGDRLFVPSASQLAMFSVPWVAPCDTATPPVCEAGGGPGSDQKLCTSDLQCHNYFANACGDSRCNTTTGCYYVPTCGGSNACCASSTSLTCSDIQSDNYNCGDCGNVCAPGSGCVGGSCVSCPACTGTTPFCNSTGTCICDPVANSCSSLGAGFTCNAAGTCNCNNDPSICTRSGSQFACQANGSCQCVPYCPANWCSPMPDGCGGTCTNGAFCGPGSVCYYGSCGCTSNSFCTGAGSPRGVTRPNAVCDTTFHTCSCAPSCAGKACGNDGCNGTCPSTCGGSTPQCSFGTNTCVCDATSCAVLGPNYTCNGTSCVCTPSCAGKTCGPDGCGGSCGTCGGTRPVCNGTSCVCDATSCSPLGANAVCNGTSCSCTPYCDPCRDVATSDGCGGNCTRNCFNLCGCDAALTYCMSKVLGVCQ